MRVAILLAAGASRRYGAANKLLAWRPGGCLLERSLDIVAAAPVARRIVVVGWQAARVADAVHRSLPGAVIVRARDHGEGMGASLRAAARALWPIEREALLFLADMPDVPPLLAAHLVRVRAPFVRPRWRGRPGHPVLLRGDRLSELASASGDAGPGRAGGARFFHAGRGCVADVDRPGRRR